MSESEGTDSFRREQRTLVLRAGSGEHNVLGIPGVEACPGFGFGKEELWTIEVFVV